MGASSEIQAGNTKRKEGQIPICGYTEVSETQQYSRSKAPQAKVMEAGMTQITLHDFSALP
jgi:hypothetical protein